jgi:hypothetical protein
MYLLGVDESLEDGDEWDARNHVLIENENSHEALFSHVYDMFSFSPCLISSQCTRFDPKKPGVTVCVCVKCTLPERFVIRDIEERSM